MTGEQDSATPSRVKAGALMVDTRTDRMGVVMGHVGPYVQLRPPAGGLEWDVSPNDLRPADAKEQLRAKVAVINARTRRRSLR